MMETRECNVEGCPYRSPARARGKQSGYCSMVRPLLAFGCPTRRSGGGRA